MGVSGAGKSVVARALVGRLGWSTAEGDDFHPRANVERMRAAVPLTDEDRRPWLDAIAAWIGGEEVAGRDAIVTCSALRRSYRDRLRSGHPSVRFAHLVVSRDRLAARVAARTDHFMPPSLLDSQIASLEPLGADEPGGTFDADAAPDVTAGRIVAALVPSAGDEP